jgi:hypothetical protein
MISAIPVSVFRIEPLAEVIGELRMLDDAGCDRLARDLRRRDHRPSAGEECDGDADGESCTDHESEDHSRQLPIVHLA